MKPAQLTLRDHDASLQETLQVLENRERAHRLSGRRNALRTLAALLPTTALLPTAALSPLGALAATCSVIPSETEGPYPGDGTNGPNALTQSGIVRSDIRSNFGSSGTALSPGVLNTITLKLVNTNADCVPLAGYAVYVWYCDAQGRYSLYSNGVTGQNFLRGVQVTDATGTVSFTGIFPGCYAGRWPHVHFEIYSSLAAATTGRNSVKISQLAMPEAACREVYTQASSLYPQSTANLNGVGSVTRDGIFSDSIALQLATTNGTVAAGYNTFLQIGVAGATAPVVSNLVSVEFYNSILNHYVVLTDPTEIAAVDGGSAGPGWTRTGAKFEFEPSPGSNSMVVHRFYGSVSPGPNSHFYTVSETEKNQLIAIAAATPATQKRWNYESAGGFRAGLANSNGCATTNGQAYYTVPVFRLYNNGFAKGLDSNHRYTTSATIAANMQAQGWTLEGVAFCAVAATVASN